MSKKIKITVLVIFIFEILGIVFLMNNKNNYIILNENIIENEQALGDAFFPGDVNGNNKIDVKDYKYIVRYIVGVMNFNDSQKKAADINGDGNITVKDYKMVVRKIIAGDVNPPISTFVPSTPSPSISAVPPSSTITPVTSTTAKIHFISLSGGDTNDAILIESKGEYGLIDAAYPSSGYCADYYANGGAVLRYLQNNGVSHLKFVIASHAHCDHIGGIPEIASLVDSSTTFIYKQIRNDSTQYGEIVINEASNFAPINENWQSTSFLEKAKNAMNSRGAKLVDTTNPSNMATLGASLVNSGDKWTNYITFNMGSLNFKIYNLPLYTQYVSGKEYIDINSNSLVILITSNSGKKILLAGDLNTRSKYEEYYASRIGHVDLLKATHHGYLFSNSKNFLNYTSPNYVYVPGKSSNKEFGAPYLYLKSRGAKIYFSDRGGAVFTIGNQISVSRNDDTMYVNNDWYKWTISENMVWVYVENGAIVSKKWIQWNGGWYYLDSNGIMLANTTATIDGKSYLFNSSGLCDSAGC